MRGAAAFVLRGRRTTHKCYNLCSTVEMLMTRDGSAVIDTNAIVRKSRFLSTPPAFDAPLGGSLSEYYHNVWYAKTIVLLPDG